MKNVGSIVMYGMVAFLVFLYISENNSGDSGGGSEVAEESKRQIQLSDEASMGGYSEEEVCKAAMSSMFFHSPSIMEVSQSGGEIYKVSYRRPSDNSLWENKCQIKGNRIYWGSFDGRWRTNELDGVILFMAFGEDLTIQENHSDGSTSVTYFEKRDDGSIVEVEL
ncbi:hypothetical protein GCM10007160_15360 [Litchfieldella qijiaojingensis]|uniref:Uncharacterized protein n=1 Tax=Litchfieldella qijiaojingensis TaxID=980347 RepID=A0ABQ2YPT6_9GAMM|nr:hypothetical protein [Halomonas qijiaojingensis]GGX88787.1 hypothetical protein GCM10007160_15360 [Halomonas qijiaojingensis]